jgi:hypothetical protein
MKKGKFSIFWFFILVLGIVWFLTEIGLLEFDIPWLPLIVIVISLGIFINKLIGK